MRSLLCSLALVVSSTVFARHSQGAAAVSPASRVWEELEAKRITLGAAHQEFEATQTSKSAGAERSLKRQLTVDLEGERWRERSASGSGDFIRVFDGHDLFRFEQGGEEYVHVRVKPKADELRPIIYQIGDMDWGKAVERGRPPCNLPGMSHICVFLEAPLKPTAGQPGTGQTSRTVAGVKGLTVDTETGLVLSVRTIRTVDDGRGGYRTDVRYTVKNLRYGGPADASLFRLPAGDFHKVKTLSEWNAARIGKTLVGHSAPELTLTDLKGEQLTLEGMKGRVVLLDFWATWCAPCRADGPALDRLFQKYGAKDLAIVGISVNEDRAIVEKFLREHPHGFVSF